MSETLIDFFGERVPALVEDTRARYLRVPREYVCDCSYCRNFAVWWERSAPSSLYSALHSLGISPALPTEIIDYGCPTCKTDHTGQSGRLYEAIWSFAGGGPEENFGKGRGVRSLEPKISLWINPPPDPGPPDGRFEPESRWTINATIHSLPWLLDEAEPPD